METVNGLNEKREIVKKELHIDDEIGAFLRYENEDTIIEPDINVWNKIYRPNDPSEGFTTAFYHMTNRCNKHCEYCYNRYLLEFHPSGTRLDQLVKSLEEFVPIDTREVVPFKDYVYDTIHPTIAFLGGEPTVAETLIPFIHYITSTRNNKMYVYTNGIKLQDIDYLKQFPNTNQIMWSISTDKNTTKEFLDTIIGNITKLNHEYGFNLIVGQTEETIQMNLELDKHMRTYAPQEIRYRAVCDQRKGTSDYISSILKFIERARGIDGNFYLDKAHVGHGGFVSTLKPEYSDDPSKGKVSVACIPVWKMTFAEMVCKWGSFMINTTYINAPAECHMNSVPLYRWRMKHTSEYISEGSKPIWGKYNQFIDRDIRRYNK